METTQVLLALDERDEPINALIRDGLESEKRIQINRVYSGEKALHRFEDDQIHPDYLVCGSRLARRHKEEVSDYGGLELCERLHGKTEAGIALVIPGGDANNTPLELQHRCANLKPRPLLCHDSDIQKVADYIRGLETPSKRLEVIIVTHESGDWDYCLVGKHLDVPFREPGTLRLGNALPKSWVKASKPLGAVPSKDWVAQFKELGENILQGIIDWNPNFASRLAHGLRLAGGLDHTRVTFFVGAGRYQIALESIFAPELLEPEEPTTSAAASPARPIAPSCPWIIKAPVLRTVTSDGTIPSCELGTGAPLKSLIICADTSGVVPNMMDHDGSKLRLAKLRHIEGECAMLELVLKMGTGVHDHAQKLSREMKAQVEGLQGALRSGFPRIEKPYRLGKGGQAPLTRESLFDILERETWHIVHFAGHSFFEDGGDDDPGRGYLFIGEPDAPEAIEISELTPFLRRCKLLYLSSCRSASASFVLQAADSGVPAVIGFRAMVPDESAKLYAATFYSRLLTQNAVDTAFLDARQRMHKLKPDDLTWASAMLIMGRGKL